MRQGQNLDVIEEAFALRRVLNRQEINPVSLKLDLNAISHVGWRGQTACQTGQTRVWEASCGRHS